MKSTYLLTELQIGDQVTFVNSGTAIVTGLSRVTSVYYRLQFKGYDKPLGFYIDGSYFKSGPSIFDIESVGGNK